MSNPGTSGSSLPNTDSVHHSGLDTSPLPANSAISAPMDSPQVPFETASSGLVSDSSPSVPPTSFTQGRGRGRGSGGGATGNRGSNSSTRRKPGRPRKFGLKDALPLPSRVVEQVTESQPNPSAAPALPPLPSPPNYASDPLPPPARPSSPSSSAKKPRGRPPGSSRKQPTGGSTSTAPVPTVTSPNHRIGVTASDVEMKAIFVSPGEDVVAKLTIFAENDAKSIFIASAFGSVSSATLRPPTASTGSTTYEGVFQITSLSGSLLQAESHGQPTWIGGLSVSLTGQDNQSHVGGVAGSMIAATPVQIIVGSFNLENEDKSKRRTNPINVTETNSPAANGAVNESGSGGDVAGTSIPDNSGA